MSDGTLTNYRAEVSRLLDEIERLRDRIEALESELSFANDCLMKATGYLA